MPITRAYDSMAEGLAFDTSFACFEVRNPAGSGKNLWILGFDFVAEVGMTEWKFMRYTGAATTGGTAAAVAVHNADTGDAASVMQIYSATADGDIDVSGLGAATYEKHVTLDPSDAGDDAEWIPGKYYSNEFKLILRPGETMVVIAPAVTHADYDIGVRFCEVDP